MKILLVGEYSRLHNSLKEGLLAIGQDVTLVSTGDFFKNYPSDIRLERRFDKGIGRKWKVLLFRLFGYDLTSASIYRQFAAQQDRLKGYDIVQLINESPFAIQPNVSGKMVNWLARHNKKLFLLSCGADHLSIKYALSDELPYSILKEYKEGRAGSGQFQWALKYLEPEFVKLHDMVFGKINGVIASDLDYHLPIEKHPQYLGLIPNPVNTDRITAVDNPVVDVIRIFLGINRSNYDSKGIRYFEEALVQVKAKAGLKVAVEVVENLPYQQYIQKFDRAHIVLDQVLGQDQGYNALEAMAKGKAVFTGAGDLFNQRYGLDAPVAIDAIPDSDNIARKLLDLIEQPEQIEQIGRRAREFVLREHHYQKIAKQYLEIWNAN